MHAARPSLRLVALLSALSLAPTAHADDLQVFTDQAAFLAATGATNATGPLPDLGLVSSATVGSITFSVAPGGDYLAIGASGTPAEPDWTALLDGHDIALGYENLQLDADTPVYALGIEFAQPDATMPSWGGTPVDSTFEISLWDGATLVGQVQLASLPVDVASFLGVWSAAAFTTVTIIDVTETSFIDDNEYFGQAWTGDVPAPPRISLAPCTDKELFLLETGAVSVTGPLPDLGLVDSVRLGSVTFGIGPGGDDLIVGAFGTPAAPDWCPQIPGHDFAQGYENLQVDFDGYVTAFGCDFVQPDATMPPFGGTPVDSTYEVSLYDGDTLLGTVTFSSIPVDVLTFLGVCSDTPFNRAILVDVTPSSYVDDDEFYGEFYAAPSPGPWSNLGHGLTGVFGDPLLSGTGTLLAGEPGTLVLQRATPSAPAYLFVALGSAPTPFKCGTLVTVPVLATMVFATDTLGEVPLAWPAWPAGLSGLSLSFQYALPDAAAVCGVALSNGLRADLP